MISNQAYIISEWFLLISLLVIGFVHFFKHQHISGSISLLFINLSLSLHLFFNISLLTGLLQSFPILILIDEINGLLFPFLLFSHLAAVTKVKLNVIPVYFTEALGLGVVIFYYFQLLHLNPTAYLAFFENLKQFKPSVFFLVPIGFIQLNDLVLFFYIIILLNKYKTQLNLFLTENNRTVYQYVLSFSIVSIGILILSVLFILIFPAKPAQMLMIPSGFYLFFLFALIRYSGIPIFEIQQNINIRNENSKTKENIEDDNIIKRIKMVLQEKQLFKNPDLTLFDLAHELSVSSSVLSHTINHEMETNFSNLVNSYRIAEAKRLMSDTEHKNLSLETIGKLSGFSNRITFYRVFKKIEGISPSGYQSFRH